MKLPGRRMMLPLTLAACVLMVWGCVEAGTGMRNAPGVQTLNKQTQKQEAQSVATATTVEAEASAVQIVEQEKIAAVKNVQTDATILALAEVEDPYALDLKPLTTPECGRCHFSVFTDIKDEGGKHQLDCTYCHEEFHTYKPGRNWADVVPACTTCHGAAHGESYMACLACHENAHAPISSMIGLDQLEPDCAKCHEPQGQELVQNPSAHTELSCSSCHHTQHGNIPDCVECHAQPHVAFEQNSGCVGCHPVHSPTNIEYGQDVANNVCAGCHQSVNSLLVNSPKKHSTLSCVYCHAQKHGYLPACQDCHGKPHSDTLLSRFNACTDCHGEPHALAFPGQ
ncbi:MAG: hypothetical protein RBR02_08590 [Desulfuromonadaceae bacterium]|nr:hypothetical protein [Desulfuromonadaceae bacterium]